MPKEKKSADFAIRLARNAARGSSIIVPIAMSSLIPRSSSTAATCCSSSLRTIWSSRTLATSGTMISGRGVPWTAMRSAAASAIARPCIRNRPGIWMPRRTPRSPSIGFCSWRRRTWVSRVAARSSTSPRSSARATSTLRSVRSGRNSCSGGSRSRMVTGRPSIASRISVKSWRCSGRSAASASSTPASSSATISFSTSSRRSPRNMCSVRHRPMPWAPKRRARAASSGCRRWCAPAGGGHRRRAP